MSESLSLSLAQKTAVLMNSALRAHGYRLYDRPLYKAFQEAAGGLVVDGWPGRLTMTKLREVIEAIPDDMAAVPFYPWSWTRGFDGVNAPDEADWLRKEADDLRQSA